MDFRSHDAFEAVLRRYGHPAAVADFEALPRGGESRNKFLEALGTACRDSCMQFITQQNMKEKEGHATSNSTVVDKKCPLYLAFVDVGEKMRYGYGSKYASNVLTGDAHQHLVDSLRVYGRPIAPKMIKKDEGPIDWSSLDQIQIKEMKLYDSNKGSYLEGILLVESFIPMVGTTTILQDSNGDVILVALYNFLPDGLHGEESVPIASMKIPKGGRMKIAAPFMKVFRDGSRGIRIDNPSDIQLLTENVDDNKDEVSALLQAKKLGNDLVAKKMYNAASDAYIGGLRKAIMVPTLLSNRSQAHAMLEEWEHSMADAAASLVIRPCNKKTWARYKKAIEALEKSESGEISERVRTGAILMRVLLSESDGTDQSSDKESKDALELKNEGNKAFQAKHFADAVKYYSASLNACGEETRALLSNWSLCCLHTHSYLDTVAAASASVRIRPEAKALIRLTRALLTLGEPELCRSLSAKYSDLTKENPATKRDNDEVVTCSEIVITFLRDPDNMKLLLMGAKYLSQWVGCIETYNAGPKGRGVRAQRAMEEGTVVLIEPPIASSHASGLERGKHTFVINISDKVYDSSQEFIKQDIILRSQRNEVLSQIVDCLYDGVNTRPVTPLKDLIPNLTLCPALLPTGSDYLAGEKNNLTSERVSSILKINSHGHGQLGLKNSMTESSQTQLYPALSMFNHSSTPTCTIHGFGGCTVVVMDTSVKAGDELTVSYGHDEEKVKYNWGISSE